MTISLSILRICFACLFQVFRGKRQTETTVEWIVRLNNLFCLKSLIRRFSPDIRDHRWAETSRTTSNNNNNNKNKRPEGRVSVWGWRRTCVVVMFMFHNVYSINVWFYKHLRQTFREAKTFPCCFLGSPHKYSVGGESTGKVVEARVGKKHRQARKLLLLNIIA